MLIFQMIPSALMVATPIIICALGGMFSERSGVVNIALEGMMTVGAFTGATVCFFLEATELRDLAPWIAILLGMVAGCIYSILLGVSAISFKADQTIAGTALNMLSLGITVYFCQILFGQQRTLAFQKGISKVKEVPILSEIPYIGEMFKGIYPTILIALVLVVIAWYVVFKTPFGLRLRACGENPQAAASMGISVTKMRYTGVLVSGAFAGLAGAIMVLTSSTQFTAGTIHGVGFISVAALIFGKWNPYGVLGAGIFFGFAQTVGAYASMIPFLNLIPSEFFNCIPYVLTVVALVVFSGKSVGPKAAGEIYDSGKR